MQNRGLECAVMHRFVFSTIHGDLFAQRRFPRPFVLFSTRLKSEERKSSLSLSPHDRSEKRERE